MRRTLSIVGVVMAAVAVGPVLLPTQAGAAPAQRVDLEVRAASTVNGRVGEIVNAGYVVRNNSNQAAAARDVALDITAPAGTEIASFGSAMQGARCAALVPKRTVRCRPDGALEGKSDRSGAIGLLVTGAAGSPGAVRVIYNADARPSNNIERLTVRVAPGTPSPSASKRSPSAKASASEEVVPTFEATSEPTEAVPAPALAAKPTDSDGISVGMWLGGFAILAAVGLLGSLLVLRMRDRSEPDEL